MFSEYIIVLEKQPKRKVQAERKPVPLQLRLLWSMIYQVIC